MNYGTAELIRILEPFQAKHWDAYGHERIYVDKKKVIDGLGLEHHELLLLSGIGVSEADYRLAIDSAKFYLDVKDMCWTLTGFDQLDIELTKALQDAVWESELAIGNDTIPDWWLLGSNGEVLRLEPELPSIDVSEFSQSELAMMIAQSHVSSEYEEEKSLKAILSNTAITENFPREVWISGLQAERFSDKGGYITRNRAENSVDPVLLDLIARKVRTVGLRELVGENPATSFETLMFIYEKGSYAKCLVNHPETPVSVLAGMMYRYGGERLKAMTNDIENFTPEILEVVCRAHSLVKLELIRKGHPCITSELLDRFSNNATVELISVILTHPKVRESTVRRLLDDSRASVLLLASRALKKWDNAPW